MNRFNLITPTRELIDIFDSFWTDFPITTVIKLFENDEEIDIKNYIDKGGFKAYGKKDTEINNIQDLQDFLKEINRVYHTRISGIEKIVKRLNKLDINDKDSLSKKIKNSELVLPQFVAFCKAETGNYTYSFATKVFSFIDEDKYPIIDSFVATLLETYEYDEKIARSKWGNYSQYINNYNAFKRNFGLTDLSFKKIDKFLWTYAKVMLDYWADLGVLSYEPVAFDTRSLKGITV